MADFDAPKLLMVGLAQIELPAYTIRLCDGGFVRFGENKFVNADPVFGAIESVAPLEERSGDEAPSGSLTFLPASDAAASQLSQPTYQGSPVKFWIGRVDEDTGELMGDPDLVFDGELDTTTLRMSRAGRTLEMGLISIAERLFNVREGNVLSSRFHQTIWPGEQGFDNATGIGGPVAWGVQSPPREGEGGSASGLAGIINAFAGISL